MNFYILTIFPESFDSYFGESILGRAQKEARISIKIYNIRDFSTDKHRTVDDTPYGGGPGMVMKPEPIFAGLEKVLFEIRKKNEKAKIRVVLTSAKGCQFDQKKAEEFSEFSDLIFICGRYEGVDQRVADFLADEEVSIGGYVLTGGELPVMVMVDAVARLIPGVLGNKESLMDSRISQGQADFEKDHPVYTKPADFRGYQVPAVLLSGNHAEIEKWRKNFRKEK